MRPVIASRILLALVLAVPLMPGAATALSRLEYANQCAAEMGKIPGFNCLNGDLLEITQNGVPVSTQVPTCDKPIQLGIPRNQQCTPFARLIRLSTGNPSVETITICRKYLPSTGPTDPRFDDIAMISHNKATGRTCFFQSFIEANLDGGTVPSPSDNTPEASKYWQERSGSGPGGIPCSSCHAADPFIWSPYVAQKADISKWDPFGKYDSNFANLFGAPAKVFQPNNNGCTACHPFWARTGTRPRLQCFPARVHCGLQAVLDQARRILDAARVRRQCRGMA